MGGREPTSERGAKHRQDRGHEENLEPADGGHDHDRYRWQSEHHDHDFSDRLNRLDSLVQYRYLSGEELGGWLDPGPDWVIGDLGSGTGFFTTDIAPIVRSVVAIDVDRRMHVHFQDCGLPANVEPVTAGVYDLPLVTDALDGAVSLRTFHHGVDEALEEVARVLRPGGRFVVVDWSATGSGERDRGPPRDRCYDLATVQSMLLRAGFQIRVARERRETFVVVATRRSD